VLRTLPTSLPGLKLIEPVVHRDDRGYFLETFRAADYASAGIEVSWVQENHARSLRGTLRGMHFQERPGQAKLVRVAHGRILDVVIDIRRSSPTFGDWQAFELDDDRNHQLFVPIGFAHGYCVTSATADVVYKVGSYYDQTQERGIAWDDPMLQIPWPVTEPIVSTRDQRNPTLREIRGTLPNW
jgi:dTDP-4-dehydrorhamnose 3,5-epimerase